jgi:hypothetical protein
MNITIKNVTPEQIDKLLEITKDEGAWPGWWWQLQGYAFGGGDNELKAKDLFTDTEQ